MNDKLIQQTKFNLTVLFWCLQLVVILLFNMGLIAFEISQTNIMPQHIVITVPLDRPYSKSIEDDIENQIEAQRNRRIFFLMINDVLIAFVAALFARFLADLTLQPLVKNMENQKQFVSNASHELRTPLSNMKTEAEVLLRDKNAGKQDYTDFTRSTIEEIDTLNQLIDNLLHFSALESTAAIKKEPTNLTTVVEKVLGTYSKQIEQKNIKIIKSNLDHSISTHSALFERMLSNIIDNAIKFNNEDGQISIIFIDESSTLKIKDTGIGISTQDISKIFDKFYMASQDRHQKGFGIGLSIVNEIATRLGIKISVNSEKDKYTEFVLNL